jgi:DNA-binding NarL/FixJ family response regulator
VLLADDYPDMVKAVSRLLALDCDVVGSVADGSALLDAAQRLQPDVIVLDLSLPNGYGLEMCRQIAAALPEIRVIVFTAAGDAELAQRSLEVGPLHLCPSWKATATCYRPSNACAVTGIDQRAGNRSSPKHSQPAKKTVRVRGNRGRRQL